MGRPSFRHMGVVARIIVGRATDATWIQDRWAVGQLDEVLLVAVAAQNYAVLGIAQSLPDRNQTCSHNSTFRRLLDEILIVIGRCAVAGENAMIRADGSR